MNQMDWEKRKLRLASRGSVRHYLRREQFAWWPSDVPQEIRSGAIISDPFGSGLALIDTNTAEGLRKFLSLEVTGLDPQSEDFRDPLAVPGVEYFVFVPPSTPWFVPFGFVGPEPKPEKPRKRRLLTQTPRTPPKQEPTTDVVLARLASPTTSREDRRRLVIDAEVAPFPTQEATRLKQLLRQFIEEFRKSDDPTDLIAVGSAIRKYVALIDENDLSFLALLLDAKHNLTVPLTIELEVTKVIVRRLAVKPPENADTQPELSGCLRDLADTYLTPRMLTREKFGAVALNAVLGLLLLRSSHIDEVLERLNRLQTPWFTDLVVRRANQIRNDLFGRFPQAAAARYSEGLQALTEKLTANEK